jgi:2,3-bisphosphoglycerate-dependent phosphoglycerate mutase
MRLLLVPHAQTDWNVEGRIQGQTDRPLSALGRRQAARLAELLANEQIDEAHASDLKRAWDTAEAIAGPRGLQVRPEPRLRELKFGNFEGMTYDEIQRADPEGWHVWETLRIGPPGGETLAQVAERVSAFMTWLTAASASEGRAVLLVAHRGTLRVLLCLVLGLPPQAYGRFLLEPASLSELQLHARGPVLVRFNDTQHLREADHG